MFQFSIGDAASTKPPKYKKRIQPRFNSLLEMRVSAPGSGIDERAASFNSLLEMPKLKRRRRSGGW